MRVTNMINNNGNKVANQFEIVGLSAGTFYHNNEKLKSGDCFQSYESNIVFKPFDGEIYLDSYYWDYSRTTGKYRNIFLGETKRETEKKIKTGEYKLINLN